MQECRCRSVLSTERRPYRRLLIFGEHRKAYISENKNISSSLEDHLCQTSGYSIFPSLSLPFSFLEPPHCCAFHSCVVRKSNSLYAEQVLESYLLNFSFSSTEPSRFMSQIFQWFFTVKYPHRLAHLSWRVSFLCGSLLSSFDTFLIQVFVYLFRTQCLPSCGQPLRII